MMSYEDMVKDFFRWKCPNLSNKKCSLDLYSATIGSELQQKYPVDVEFLIKFCKNLLAALESDTNNNDDRNKKNDQVVKKWGTE